MSSLQTDVGREQEGADVVEGERAGEPAEEIECGGDEGGVESGFAGGEGVGRGGDVGGDVVEFGGEDFAESGVEGVAFGGDVGDEECDAMREVGGGASWMKERIQ